MVKMGNLQIRKKFIDCALLIAVLAGWGSLGVATAAAPQRKAKKPSKAPAKTAKTAKTSKKASPSLPSYRSAEGSMRDPFKLPPKATEGGTIQAGELAMGALPAGSRGLIIGELKLEGIVRQGKDNPKMIAVLANPANRAFFLHENDPLYNGVITKITPDTVYFKEDVRDATGNTTSREVIKKLAPAPGEKK